MENGRSSLSLREAQFMQLVSMFQIAALQQMGKLPNPLTNEIEQDLGQARGSIDFIEMIKEKTKGNLSGREKEFVEKVLFELHMNFVDEAEKKAKENEKGESQAQESGGQKRAEESSGGADSTKTGKSDERADPEADTRKSGE